MFLMSLPLLFFLSLTGWESVGMRQADAPARAGQTETQPESNKSLAFRSCVTTIIFVFFVLGKLFPL